MEYYKLILDMTMTIVFTWFFAKSIKRYGFAKSLIAIDIMLGLFAGLYLIIASIF